MNKWVRSIGGMLLTGENRRRRRQTCSSASHSTTNHVRIGVGAGPCLRSELQPRVFLHSAVDWNIRTFTRYTVCLQMNGAVSKVNKKFICRLTRAKRTPSAAATVQVSHALQAVRFSCLLRGRGVSLQDGAAVGKVFLCSPFWGVQICD